ncbi:MAG: AAA+ family ATPase [Planctomycetota bacterium]|nr:MAG: AAA+ family ATPase [Planctomycetota bacterium]
MAISNQERVGKALEKLKQGLAPFVDREFSSLYQEKALEEANQYIRDPRQKLEQPFAEWDAAALLKLVWDAWNSVFRQVLGQAERTLVSELREVRNRWAHQQSFSSDDTYRALDSAARLLTAVSSREAGEVEKMRMELLRVRFDQEVRNEKRKSAGTAIESQATGQLKPWREIVSPHKDVASGRYQQAEFAADLWQVHIGEGADEYRDPIEFFRRTFLTESLKGMLVGAVRRLASEGGDPVVQLQTNFGGGKTHSMLALYHLFSGVVPGELPGIDAVLQEAEVNELPAVKRVVLVGNKISPGNPSIKADGTVVRTFWGELAWQLGGKEAFELLRADDERATSPGDVLRTLFNKYGPCLILIDEWVAYARQLHDQSDLPAGGFETQFSFAQVLTESAKLAKHCLLVVSLPASDTAGSPHTQADDAEVGGARGREALDRLRNVIGRVESSWRPASAEEGFEIVRRRLFEPMTDPAQFKDRDVIARAFADLYRTQHQEFPPECRDGEYERRLKAAYPIHPEIFDRLYTDWSTLVKFQRTRGVLRLMAAVIHSLWEKGDRNPLIMPSNISIDDSRVQFELTRYLSDNWVPVIEKDVDGANSLPLQIDGNVPNLGKFAACRRAARAVYMGSAPTASAANRGLEDRRIKLGCVMPGESPALFGDALRRLASSATYLYQDGPRYWYSTQPTVTKLAEDRAEQLKRDPDAVAQALDERLRADLRQTGDFMRVHPLPQTGQDVPDDLDCRLVVLGIDHPYSKDAGNAAETAAKAILESRGNAPRLFQNTLMFLAVDKTRLQDLDEAVRKQLAWQSIIEEKETLNLDPHQLKQAESQCKAAASTVTARIPEAYQWLLIPTQATPQSKVEWQASRLTGQEALAERASKKVRGDQLYTSFAATLLRMEMDRVPLWRGNHVSVKQIAEDFARYLYLTRLRNTDILLEAIRTGGETTSWQVETFAFAESYDEKSGRYLGLRTGGRFPVADANAPGLLVSSEAAAKQLAADRKAAASEPGPTDRGHGAGGPEGPPPPPSGGEEPGTAPSGGDQPPPDGSRAPKRFHGSVILDSSRVGRDASRIADEVLSHLEGLLDAKLRVTLEVEAEIPDGAPENVVRTVTENCRTLKFRTFGFERE